jgi:uncharacterized protein (TIGR00255 family)
MTGFASIGRESPDGRVSVTIKSVNHRFLDLAVKAPAALAAVETRVRARVQQRLARGRVEATLTADATARPERDVVLDEVLLGKVAAAIETARSRGFVTGELGVSDLLRLPQVLDVRVRPAGESTGLPDPLAALVDEVVDDALDALVVMRETEGRFMGADLETRLTAIAGFVDAIEAESRLGQEQLETRLRARLAALPLDVQGDPAAIAQEIVRFVARSDIDEEVVRMRSHLEHWRSLAAGPEPCGRKLDFLVQEMNREINTMGSKVEGARATEIVIAAKAELERVREQTQNVE